MSLSQSIMHMTCKMVDRLVMSFVTLMACLPRANLVPVPSHPINSNLAWCASPQLQGMLSRMLPYEFFRGPKPCCFKLQDGLGQRSGAHCYSKESSTLPFLRGAVMHAKREDGNSHGRQIQESLRGVQDRMGSHDHVIHARQGRDADDHYKNHQHEEHERTPAYQSAGHVRSSPGHHHHGGLDSVSSEGLKPRAIHYHPRSSSPNSHHHHPKDTTHVWTDENHQATPRRHPISSRGELGRPRGVAPGRDSSSTSRLTATENSTTLTRIGSGGGLNKARPSGTGHYKAAEKHSSGPRHGGTGLASSPAGKKKPRRLAERGESLYAVAMRHEKKGNYPAARRIFEMLAVNS